MADYNTDRLTIGSNTYRMKDTVSDYATNTALAGKQDVIGSSEKTVLTVTPTELNYVAGVTSAVQTQLDAKPDSLSDLGVTATTAEVNVLDGITATTTELNYTDGVTSNIQTQLDAKDAKGKITVSGTEYSVTRKALTITDGSTTTTYYVADIS